MAVNGNHQTPGPWHLEARGRGIQVFAVFGQNDEHVAKVDGAENAALIAAAPELKAALTAFVAFGEAVALKYEASNEEDAVVLMMLSEANALLARVGGL